MKFFLPAETDPEHLVEADEMVHVGVRDEGVARLPVYPPALNAR